ncbi:MAG: prepilin-type cleavage/methylation domain-containing protein [Gallionella sp.]
MKNFKRMLGFSLLEMAVVMLILGLLLTGLLPTLSAQVEQQRIVETRKQLNEIRDALLGFAVSQGRLPCPAESGLAIENNAGLEAVSGVGANLVCASNRGVLPWATLGVPETDAWGRRYSYRVTATFADGEDGTAASCAMPSSVSFQLCSLGNLTVLKTAGGAKVSDNVPVVVVSHGQNGWGAYTPQGKQLAGATGDEAENVDNNNTFVSKEFGVTYDDLVLWLSPPILMNRMVAAGKLP